MSAGSLMLVKTASNHWTDKHQKPRRVTLVYVKKRKHQLKWSIVLDIVIETKKAAAPEELFDKTLEKKCSPALC